MSITPRSPDLQARRTIRTWVNSQWKFMPLPGQLSVEINRLLSEQNFSAQRLEEIIRIAHGSGAKGVFNNAAQAWNHSFFWESMAPKAVKPSGLLASAISSEFGSLETLGERFTAEGTGHFGSGWVWLIAKRDKLEVISTHDAGSPILEEGVTPLLACDVWEHAYYIDYRNVRPDYMAAFWNLVNWDFVSSNLG